MLTRRYSVRIPVKRKYYITLVDRLKLWPCNPYNSLATNIGTCNSMKFHKDRIENTLLSSNKCTITPTSANLFDIDS